MLTLSILATIVTLGWGALVTFGNMMSSNGSAKPEGRRSVFVFAAITAALWIMWLTGWRLP